VNGDGIVEARLQKWGNSDGIRIPSAFLKALNLKTNDSVTIVQDGDRIIITKSNKNKISLKELFDNYNGGDLSNEFKWDNPVGREIW
jgi:antitoxin MazE